MSSSDGEVASSPANASETREDSRVTIKLKMSWLNVSTGSASDDSANQTRSPATSTPDRSFKRNRNGSLTDDSKAQSPMFALNKAALLTSSSCVGSFHHSTPHRKSGSPYYTSHRRRSGGNGNCSSSFSAEESDSFRSYNSSRDSKRMKLADGSSGSLTVEIPCYKGYQLLGDSQMVRFSEQLLNMRSLVTYTDDGRRRLGYCVSGQKIGELEKRLELQKEPLSTKVIVMIGTNDFVYRTDFTSMYKSYNSIINILKKTAERIVLLTVPPVPRLAKNPKHLVGLKQFNDYILTFADSKKIFAIDIASIFVSYSNTLSDQYFERVINGKKGVRNDLVHLNTMGFRLLKATIDANYFNE